MSDLKWSVDKEVKITQLFQDIFETMPAQLSKTGVAHSVIGNAIEVVLENLTPEEQKVFCERLVKHINLYITEEWECYKAPTKPVDYVRETGATGNLANVLKTAHVILFQDTLEKMSPDELNDVLRHLLDDHNKEK